MSTVLLADDQTEMIELFDAYLSREGHQILSAANGEKAYELAIRHEPEIIISDLYMPSITGLQLAKRLRRRSHCSFILLTGYPDFDPAELLDAGVGSVLIKPIDPKAIVALVKSESDYFDNNHKYTRKRRFIRRTVNTKGLHCTIESSTYSGPAQIQNIGMGGLGLEIPEQFSGALPAIFRFQINSPKANLVGQAELRWQESRKNCIFIGCEFTTDTKEKLLRQGLIGRL